MFVWNSIALQHVPFLEGNQTVIIFLNFLNRHCFLLRLHTKSTEKCARKVLTNVLNTMSEEDSDLVQRLGISYSRFVKHRKDLIIFHVVGSDFQKELITFLKINRHKENGFTFRRVLTKKTRLQKLVIGKIVECLKDPKKYPENVSKKFCQPRFMNKAYLAIDSNNGQKKPDFLNYETTLARFGEYLTPEAKTEIFEMGKIERIF